MAKLKDVTKAVVKQAKTTAGRVGKGGRAAAEKSAAQAGRLAKKAVGKARTGATALVVRAADAMTGKAKQRKRMQVAIVTAGAIVGAAAVAAAGVRAAKARKR